VILAGMAKKAKKPRGSNDPALSGFKALQHVIEVTEGKPSKAPQKAKKR